MWGLKVPVAILIEDREVWERGVWLLEGGAARGRDWLGLRPEEEVVWGSEVRLLTGAVLDVWHPAGGVASSSGLRVPGGVTGGKVTDVSKRALLPSGDCGVLSSFDASRPFWY